MLGYGGTATLGFGTILLTDAAVLGAVCLVAYVLTGFVAAVAEAFILKNKLLYYI